MSKKKLFLYLYFIEFLLRLIYSNSKFSSTEAYNCLKKNNYNNIKNASKTIGSPSVCHSVSKQCCFINITHYYGDYLLTQEYCNYFEGKVNEFKQFLQDLYEDDEKYYANFTAHNTDMYQTIGRNLDYSLIDKLNCFLGPKSYTEYSTYVVNNCKEFQNGKCTGPKNNTEMNIFMSNFHKKYSDAYCNKNEEGNKCVMYNGTRGNDKMVMPLLEELKDYLQADNDEYLVVNNETNVDINPDGDEDDDGESTYLTNWTINHKFIKNCTKRPTVIVEVNCSSDYNGQIFIKYSSIHLFLFLLCFL